MITTFLLERQTYPDQTTNTDITTHTLGIPSSNSQSQRPAFLATSAESASMSTKTDHPQPALLPEGAELFSAAGEPLLQPLLQGQLGRKTGPRNRLAGPGRGGDRLAGSGRGGDRLANKGRGGDRLAGAAWGGCRLLLRRLCRFRVRDLDRRS